MNKNKNKSVTKTLTVDKETDEVLKMKNINFSKFVRDKVKETYPQELEEARVFLQKIENMRQEDFKARSFKE